MRRRKFAVPGAISVTAMSADILDFTTRALKRGRQAVAAGSQESRPPFARRDRLYRERLAGGAARHRHRPRCDAHLPTRGDHRRCRTAGRHDDRQTERAVRGRRGVKHARGWRRDGMFGCRAMAAIRSSSMDATYWRILKTVGALYRAFAIKGHSV